MKNCFVLFLLLFATFSFSQKKPVDMGKITKEKLAEVKFLGELVKDLPAEMRSVTLAFTCKINGHVTITPCKTIEFPDNVKNMLAGTDADSEISVDVTIDGDRSKTKSYTYHVVK